MRTLIIFMALVALATVAHTQTGQDEPAQQQVITDPAEYNAYITAINQLDPADRASALESFIQQYPGTVMKSAALQLLLVAYGASGNQSMLEETTARVLADDPNNLRALAIATAIGRAQGTPQSIGDAVAHAQTGLQALATWTQPEDMTDEEFGKSKDQMTAIFEGASGFAALQARNYATARTHLLKAIEKDSDNLQNNYQLAVAELEMTPLNLDGFWYGAKAIRLAADRPDMRFIESYIKAKYKKYHGTAGDWDDFAAAVAGQTTPPADMAELIPAAPTPCDLAVQAARDNDPDRLSISDWEFILSRANCSPANHDAADKVWQAILKKQKTSKGDEAKIRLPGVLVVSATEDTVQVAVTEENQCGQKVDLAVTLAITATKPPSPGTAVDVEGVFTRYRPEPFQFIMEQGTLKAVKRVKLSCP